MTLDGGVIPHVLCHRCSRIIHSDWVQERLARLEPWTSTSTWTLDGDAGQEEKLRFFHSESLEELEASAAAGCHLCTLISKKNQYFEWFKDEEHTGVVQVVACAGHSSVWLETSRIQELEIEEDMPHDLPGLDGWLEERYNQSLDSPGAWIMDDFVTVQLRKVQSDTYSLAGPDSNFPLSASSDAPQVLESIQHWLKDCVDNHPECNRYSSTQKGPTATWLPTRLIDVGEVPGKLAPRLVISADEGLAQKKAHYLTLSHSWSISTKPHNLKLETENMTQLQDRIPLDDRLSKTFRDAMKITQQLGCRYIWIDSLCIIQSGTEAKDDWKREGLTMSDVYGHSRCNITALGTGGNDGCYTPRNPLQTSPCRIKVCDEKSAIYAVNSLLENTFTENVEQSPLFKRGWVFQESVLSSRAVYFGAPQLFWECRRQAFAESWPFKTGTPRVQQRLTEPTLRATGDTPFSSKTVFEALCNAEEQQTDGPLEQDDRAKHLIEHTFPSFLCWEKIVKTFIGTSLTFTSDRLFAMAGIARAIEHFRSFTYVTGTWRELYPLDLLWRFTRELGERKNVVSGSNAPSWSWAAKELDMQESLKNIARSGKNTQRPAHWDGNKRYLVESVTSVAYLSQLVKFPNPPFESKYRPDKEGEITIDLKGRVCKGFVKTELGIQDIPQDRLYVAGQDKAPVIVHMDDDTPADGLEVVLVLLMEWEGLVGNYWKRQFQAGLVLVPAKDEGDKGGSTIYRRVGAFRTGELSECPVNAFDGSEMEEVLGIC
ncbi:heterokaryon incompatibility protein domain-containing protein [Neurospora intermedia]|uniref:Heterokaryon incompatibility protein domain-containing protein n=1 Tax=Neurospora intermedia TaxID=5142 RepID=A0ABR3DEL8_NEUIN